jgi:hypothetical protein
MLPQPAFGGTETLLIEAKEGHCCLLQVGGISKGVKNCVSVAIKTGCSFAANVFLTDTLPYIALA